MWAIRQEQVETFRHYHLKKFEDGMAAHLANFAPKHWQVIGEETGRQVIRFGIEQARRYGFTNRGPVRFYIDLMFVFGSSFDTDPQLPWVSAALKKPEMPDQMVRADWLFDEFKRYMAQVRGPNHKYFIEALWRLNEIPIEKLIISGIPLEESAVRGFRTIYPQAHDYLGEAGLRTIVRQSFAVGGNYGLTSDKAMLLMVGLSCFMGHGFANDPLCGWIGRRLDGTRLPDPDRRTDELYGKAILYMKHVLGQDARGKS